MSYLHHFLYAGIKLNNFFTLPSASFNISDFSPMIPFFSKKSNKKYTYIPSKREMDVGKSHTKSNAHFPTISSNTSKLFLFITFNQWHFVEFIIQFV